jgi:hypothetical protein
MSITNDNLLELQSAGQADWDSGLNADFSILERGYHGVFRAGAAINTGHVVWINSGGYAFHFNPNSEDARPHGFAFTGAASGDNIQLLLTGIVRSLGVCSASIPGLDLFVSPASPGYVASSYSAASRRIGIGAGGWGVYFNPWGQRNVEETLTRSINIVAVVGSDHLFSIDPGKRGWVREARMISNSADLVSLTFYSGSTRASSERLYETRSGGVTTVGSFLDRAGWPYENTEANTLSGLLFGKVSINSGAGVTSNDLQVRLVVDRWR